MKNLSHYLKNVSAGLLIVSLLVVGSTSSVHAATKVAAPKPTLGLHYVYNCTNPTVEVTFSNLSGPKDVYFQDDSGIVLIASNFTFNAATVYDGFYSFGSVEQVDVFVTNAGAGPYANRTVNKSTAATSLCPVYYPEYNANSVEPTPPAGSTSISFDYLAWYRAKN